MTYGTLTRSRAWNLAAAGETKDLGCEAVEGGGRRLKEGSLCAVRSELFRGVRQPSDIETLDESWLLTDCGYWHGVRDHPRGCGEHPVTTTPLTEQQGPSPRGCGEHPTENGGPPPEWGPSPRVRGAPDAGHGHGRWDGTIPAGAGSISVHLAARRCDTGGGT